MTGATEPFSRRRSMKSGLWATIQQFVTLGSTAISGILLARVLSVSDFGVFSFATSLAGMGTTILTAGLSVLAIKILVDRPENARRTMTALILIREFFALVAFAVLFPISLTVGDSAVIATTAIALLVLFARALDASELWFQAEARSGSTAPVRISVVVVMLAIRVGFALAGADLTAFIVLYVVETFVISLLLIVRYLTDKESPGFGKPELRTPRTLLGASWIMLLASLASQVNSRGDVVVIQALLSSSSVGLYSAAARLSEMLYFLPVVFMTATFPRLLQVRRAYGETSQRYRRELQASYDRAFWAGVLIAGLLLLIGPWLLTTLYGADYAESGRVLQIHVLALPFFFVGAVASKFIVAENALVASLIASSAGAVLNIGLNFLLIPMLGIEGSAWATVVSYFTATYLATFVLRRTRVAGIQITIAFAYPARLVLGALRKRRTPADDESIG